jgi:cob(I)alamin adenosyltransferase
MKGLVMINTGNGKGKTTTALGMALRSIGQGGKVLVLQVIKGAWVPGEVLASGMLEPFLKIRAYGQGFVRESEEVTESMYF